MAVVTKQDRFRHRAAWRPDRGQVGFGVAHQMVEHTGPGQQGLTFEGEDNTAASAFEQAGSQSRLKSGDRSGDRRLRNGEAACRTADAPCLTNLMEFAQSAQVCASSTWIRPLDRR